MKVILISDKCLFVILSLMIVVSFQPAPYETNLYDTKLTCFISTVLGIKAPPWLVVEHCCVKWYKLHSALVFLKTAERFIILRIENLNECNEK